MDDAFFLASIERMMSNVPPARWSYEDLLAILRMVPDTEAWKEAWLRRTTATMAPMSVHERTEKRHHVDRLARVIHQFMSLNEEERVGNVDRMLKIANAD